MTLYSQTPSQQPTTIGLGILGVLEGSTLTKGGPFERPHNNKRRFFVRPRFPPCYFCFCIFGSRRLGDSSYLTPCARNFCHWIFQWWSRVRYREEFLFCFPDLARTQGHHACKQGDLISTPFSTTFQQRRELLC